MLRNGLMVTHDFREVSLERRIKKYKCSTVQHIYKQNAVAPPPFEGSFEVSLPHCARMDSGSSSKSPMPASVLFIAEANGGSPTSHHIPDLIKRAVRSTSA